MSNIRAPLSDLKSGFPLHSWVTLSRNFDALSASIDSDASLNFSPMSTLTTRLCYYNVITKRAYAAQSFVATIFVVLCLSWLFRIAEEKPGRRRIRLRLLKKPLRWAL